MLFLVVGLKSTTLKRSQFSVKVAVLLATCPYLEKMLFLVVANGEDHRQILPTATRHSELNLKQKMQECAVGFIDPSSWFRQNSPGLVFRPVFSIPRARQTL